MAFSNREVQVETDVTNQNLNVSESHVEALGKLHLGKF